MSRLIALAALVAVGGFSPASAVAVAGSDFSFQFTGTCTDCSGTVEATLKLQDYTLGSSISYTNFKSFSYGGSNLFPSYLLNSTTWVDGLMGANGAYFYILTSQNGNPYYFQSYTNGFWTTGSQEPLDYGTAGNWTTVSQAVPEPTTWAMFIGGFGLIGSALRRKKIKVSLA
ncbi:MAG: PEPxxWA-CTERM sorting domain-containing protein [Janthinobacterium lividum]